MFPTLEVRWFENGPLPPRLLDWLDDRDPDPPSTWTDLYLPCEDAGFNLKVRDQKCQIKRRLAGPVRHPFRPEVTGRYEEWIKWSFDLAEGTRIPSDDPTALWTPIEKTRRQRRWPPESQSRLTETLPTSPPATVMIELTALTAPEQRAWTLCVEAEGPPSVLRDTLTTAAGRLLDAELPVSLSAEQSFGYVHWLQQLPSVHRAPAPEYLVSLTK